MIPLFRSVIRAGDKGPVLDDTTEEFDIGQHYANTAVYEIAGDSMIEAGIDEGDRVVVRLGYVFKNRDIILCRYNGEMMVKGASIINGMIWLIPAHQKMHPWMCKETDEFQCIGTVCEIIKRPSREWWRSIDLNKLSGGKG